MKRENLTIGQVIITRVVVYLGLIVIIFPILWIISIAFRSPDRAYDAYFFIIPKSFSLQNFLLVKDFFNNFLGISITRMFFNSILVTTVSIVISIVISAFSAFSFSNYKFKGKEVIFLILLVSFMLPFHAIIIPLYLELNYLHILDTYLALILPYIAFSIPISTLILRRFFEEIPVGLRDASRIDGASDFYYFIKIVLPLSKPAIATCIIFLFLEFWNEFLFAFVFIRNYSLQTIPAVMARVGGGKTVVPLGTYTAAIVIVIIPVLIVFMIFQRWFIKGIVMGALKE
jgi:ABC-type glycerol-3-phosphate transport system permease component